MSNETTFSVNPIGVIRSSLKTTQDAPPDGQHSLQKATLEIFPCYCLALSGMQDLSRIVVFYWLHEADREVLRVYPNGNRNKEMIGVFCNRSPLRPNPVGFSIVDVVEVGIDKVVVKGLDAIDGTPLIDIKAGYSCA
jgi:tRNA-Thr(GGU) m(6)t(6)A37 methyltransferase TsaA